MIQKKHINKYVETLFEIQNGGDYFVTGGDLNSVPPGSIIDFCDTINVMERNAIRIMKTIPLIRLLISHTLKVSLKF